MAKFLICLPNFLSDNLWKLNLFFYPTLTGQLLWSFWLVFTHLAFNFSVGCLTKRKKYWRQKCLLLSQTNYYYNHCFKVIVLFKCWCGQWKNDGIWCIISTPCQVLEILVRQHLTAESGKKNSHSKIYKRKWSQTILRFD